MKRLLCVLMVMVMAVLMVPTIASGEVLTWTFIDGGIPHEIIVDVDVEPTSEDDSYTMPAPYTPADGRTFLGWAGENGQIYPQGTKLLRAVKERLRFFWGIVIVPGTFEAKWSDPEPEPEPDPVVVVEEKKPEDPPAEEPHVHAEEWVPGTPATCTSTGLTDGSKCKWCGEVLKAQTEIPKIDHVYSMWVPNGSGKHYASCLYCGNKIDAACEKVQLPIKSTSGAAVTLCPVCGDCSGATATAVKGSQVGEGAPYRGTLRVWNIDAGDGNKYLAVSFDRFGKVMQPEGEVSVTLPAELKGATAGVIGADGSVNTVQEFNGTLKLDFTGSPVVVLKGN